MANLVLFFIIFILSLVLLIFCIDFFREKSKLRSISGTVKLKELFLYNTTNLEFKRLNRSNLQDKFKLLFSNKNPPLFASKLTYKSKDYLLTISKFVDYKINNNKKLYRSKSSFILIEQIANILVKNIITSGKCDAFKKFKMMSYEYSLRKKELAIFKLLFVKFLLNEIYQMEIELQEISNVIIKSKTAKRVRKYKKMILFQANLYGIYKFNKNSTKLLELKKDSADKASKQLFLELNSFEQKLKLLIIYTKVIFN